MNVGLLVSGDLGLEVLKSVENPSFVFTDKDSKQIIDYCDERNIPALIGNPRLHDIKGLEQFLEFQKKADIVFSANYKFILSKKILNLFPLAINIHGSKLPKYRGRTPHVWAIINGEQEVGITAHLMESELDAGDIVHQEVVWVSPTDTGANILEKFKKRYPCIIKTIISYLEREVLTYRKQNMEEATYSQKISRGWRD